MIDTVSLIIPTHNRCDLIGMTMDSVAEMTLPAGVETELIVVANACTDHTEEVVAQRSTRMPIPTRCVVEHEPGSSVARNRGMLAAQGQLLAFLDDDVQVCRDWLVSMLNAFETTPAGQVGGRVKLWWGAVDRPGWFNDKLEALFAAKDHGDQIIEILRPTDLVTANYAVLREAYEKVGGFRPELGRRGKGGGSYEDPDFIERVMAAGYPAFYTPHASINHWIEPDRLRMKEIQRMAFEMASTRVRAKKTFGPLRAARSFVGYSWIVLRYALPELWCRLLKHEYGAINQRLRYRAGLGGLNGAIRRLIDGEIR